MLRKGKPELCFAKLPFLPIGHAGTQDLPLDPGKGQQKAAECESWLSNQETYCYKG